MSKPNRAPSKRKPSKPKFPLWLHAATGQWAKKLTVAGKKRVFYFGTDPDKALAEWQRTKDDLRAGRIPKPEGVPAGGLTLRDLANHFITFKKHQVDTGEITRRSFQDYFDTCERLLTHFGKGVVELLPSDFLAYRAKLAETRGPHAIANEVGRVRVLFNFAFRSGLIDKPVRFGEFKKPKRAAFRRARAETGPRMFEPAELRLLIESADTQLKAMILLAANCGYGNADLGTLPRKALDLASGWATYPRPKTGIERRAPLWPETVVAAQAALAARRSAADPGDEPLAFITKRGYPWHRDDGKRASPLSAEFRKLLVRCGLYRPGLSFYTLRHVFATIASETGDETATRIVLGHSDETMLGVYRERFPDDRLRRVVDHVRHWLLGAVEGGAQ